MLKKYDQLRSDLQEIARELHPQDYTQWLYKQQGVEIAFSTKGGTIKCQ